MPSGLPPGLAINSATGEILGTPTTPGVYSFTVQVVDANRQIARRNVQVTIYAVAFVNSVPDGFVSVVYSEAYIATGGTAPYSFAVVSGSLPTGLTLSSSGALSGTPTTPGTYAFTVRVTDANSFTADLAESVDIT